ncbi:MAG: 2-phospho-L-lactate guanylyltransferase [Haloarculaceae archaeon]
MDTIVPFDATTPKTRLAPVLDAEERRTFARAMLEDVLGTLAPTPADPLVLATAPVDCTAAVEVDDRPLTGAVNDHLRHGSGPTAVVMADLALATPASVERLFVPGAGVTLVPGRGGGTNALVARDPAFRVDYHGASFRDHRRTAESVDASVATVDSFRLSTDVDEPADLVEVLLHAPDGAAGAWLADRGFEVAVEGDDERVVARQS